jgi:GH43 family beta-xylosidase
MTTSQYFGTSFAFKWSNETYKQCSKPIIRNWNNAGSKLLFQPSKDMKYSTDLWAPEFHRIDNSWYVIFTADPNGDSPPPDVNMYCDRPCPAVHHRVYVLEGSDSDSWEATFTPKAQLNTYDQFAIDGTYFQHSTGLFYVCSFWYRQYDG